MKFRIFCKNKGTDDSTGHWEDYDKEVEDPQSWAKQTIENFNNSLKPGEQPRELLKVEILGEGNKFHDWIKRTGGMSVMFRGQCVDECYCSRCKVTGKRFGLSRFVKRDSKFRAKKYEYCNPE